MMIAESVVSDRLHSAAGTVEDRVKRNVDVVYVPFAALIERARRQRASAADSGMDRATLVQRGAEWQGR